MSQTHRGKRLDTHGCQRPALNNWLNVSLAHWQTPALSQSSELLSSHLTSSLSLSHSQLSVHVNVFCMEEKEWHAGYIEDNGESGMQNSLKVHLERIRSEEAPDTHWPTAQRHKDGDRKKKKFIFVYSATGQWPLIWRKSLSMGEQRSDLIEELMGSGGEECVMSEGKRVWKVEICYFCLHTLHLT